MKWECCGIRMLPQWKFCHSCGAKRPEASPEQIKREMVADRLRLAWEECKGDRWLAMYDEAMRIAAEEPDCDGEA
jgi:hypothetical protein